MKSEDDEAGWRQPSENDNKPSADDINMAAAVASLQREHLEYRNTSNKSEGGGQSAGLSAGSRRQSTGDIPYEDLPRALIATNIPEVVFTDAAKKKAFEDLFCAFGENVHFVYLPSFRRVRVGYENPEQVVRARIGMHQREICGQPIKLFFLQPVKFNNSSSTLELPEPTKQYLLSPPASPPVGWEPVKESEPVIDYDVLAALANLAPGQVHELHAPDDNKPGIFVLPCEDPPQKGPKMKIQHTRRPEPS
ncbi:calcipressin-1-like [Acanthaster planci]|uniref:Calcipressin-1-like n=1 Tax=Acanthaster planci TaxID=133434 RepID=A0A8B7YNA6_ACAPL|nr:calcipressin-1-like [Acanthaster planci]